MLSFGRTNGDTSAAGSTRATERAGYWELDVQQITMRESDTVSLRELHSKCRTWAGLEPRISDLYTHRTPQLRCYFEMDEYTFRYKLFSRPFVSQLMYSDS